jgi:cysteine desulfuration protein SufE
MNLKQLEEDFALLERWEDKYRYLIDMGNHLEPLSESEKTRANKVSGCVSQVWLVKEESGGKLNFRGTSDALIVRGLIGLLLLLYSNKTSNEILATDAHKVFEGLGLSSHITPQRSDGFSAMVARIQDWASAVQK